ncbi:MAG: molybdate ABC transporter substrate-binding protein [Planctomycetes bacterium]|nr:molybdate ABC transporter substrate-binding protein [Planctomycetota bacterium]
MVLAAASTTDAVKEVARLFEERRGVEVKVSTGPSSGLAQQIIAGAPADVFLSANEQWGRTIEEEGLAALSKPLLANRLVLVVPRGNPAGVASPADLRSEAVERIALAGEHVPAGIYADDALRALDLREELAAAGKIVRGHDVRVALTYVEQAEVEAGIVYSTDAKRTDRVEAAYVFPPEAGDPIRYPALLINRKDASPAAAQFFEFLFSEHAAGVFQKHGFTLVETSVPDASK